MRTVEEILKNLPEHIAANLDLNDLRVHSRVLSGVPSPEVLNGLTNEVRENGKTT